MIGTRGLKVRMAKTNAGKAVARCCSAHAWKMGKWIRVIFDEIMIIKCLDIVLDINLWRENATKVLNPVSYVICQTYGAVTFL